MVDKDNKNSNVIIHSDLLAAQRYAYEPAGLVCTNVIKEEESAQYGAFEFAIDNCHITFRVAKITPTKVGQFVTLWKRLTTGIIAPYDMADPINLFVISVRTGERLGQFVFPKTMLCNKGVLSKEGIGGKRALRVYPPWDTTDNKQAKNTQAWQLHYFFEIHVNKPVNISAIHALFL